MIKFHLRQQPEAWHTAQDEDADEHALPPILCPARRQLCVLASPMPLPGYVAGRSLAHCGLQSHRCAADCVASGGGAVRRGAAQCGKLTGLYRGFNLGRSTLYPRANCSGYRHVDRARRSRNACCMSVPEHISDSTQFNFKHGWRPECERS